VVAAQRQRQAAPALADKDLRVALVQRPPVPASLAAVEERVKPETPTETATAATAQPYSVPPTPEAVAGPTLTRRRLAHANREATEVAATVA
jgi:hypothetical protein